MPNIRRASRKDLDQISSLARSYSLEAMHPDEARERGFLVSAFSRAEYEEFLQRANHFYVVDQEHRIEAFVLAYTSDRIRGDEWLNQQLKQLYPESFVVVKQICVRPERGGLGVRLYEHLARQVADLPMMAAIVLEPPNERSIQFHERLGWRNVVDLRPPDGLLRGVWRKEALGASEPSERGTG